MAVTLFASSSDALEIGTETFIDVNEPGVFTFHVDKNLMQAGDIVEGRAYRMVLTGGTSRVVFVKVFLGAQDAEDMIFDSPPLGNNLTDGEALRFSLKQTAGTGRALPRKVLKYA
jgi:hypothetical protein